MTKEELAEKIEQELVAALDEGAVGMSYVSHPEDNGDVYLDGRFSIKKAAAKLAEALS